MATGLLSTTCFSVTCTFCADLTGGLFSTALQVKLFLLYMLKTIFTIFFQIFCKSCGDHDTNDQDDTLQKWDWLPSEYNFHKE